VLLPVAIVTPFSTKALSLETVAAEPSTATLLAGILVLPATVNVPLRLAFVNSFTLNVWTSAFTLRLVKFQARS
jgi:hypothetical protein